MDVTDRGAAYQAVNRAHRHFGRLDIVINNAGYGLFGTIEEVTEEQARAPPLEIAKARYAERLSPWEEWKDLSIAAQG